VTDPIARRLRAAAKFRLWSPTEVAVLVRLRMCDDATIAAELNRLPEARGAHLRTASGVKKQRWVLGIERRNDGC
jgi:hypothetical protein